MKVFVTGATGFLGGRLTQKLLDRGDEVVAPVRRDDVDLGGAHVVHGDVSNRRALRNGIRGCDAVFHVAARYEVGIPRTERDAMFEVNVRGTENVLDAAAGVARVVDVSTIRSSGCSSSRRDAGSSCSSRSPTSASTPCTSTMPPTGCCWSTIGAGSASRTCSGARSRGSAR
jgi:nucleoside-diphosphate-sugar epimerase